MGTLSAFPRGERERELTLAHPASAPAPVGGALEEGKEVAVDRFPDLWALWSSARSWPDDDEAAARRTFATCRDADHHITDQIIAAARAWINAVEPRFVPKLSKWLTARGWEKPPPARRQRKGKPPLAELMIMRGRS